MIDHVLDAIAGKAPAGALRSPEWPAVRRAHLAVQPACARCGGLKKLQVHCVIPYHVRPDLELDPGNLVTLCESGAGGVNCHLAWGHLGDFKCANPTVREDADAWRKKLQLRRGAA